MSVVYSIRDWDENFETAQSRKVKGPLDWVAMPTKHDGKSYGRIMQMDDGPTIYAAWALMVQVAAKCPVRGVLADKDGPLTADDLATKTKFPESLFSKALAELSSPKIAWLAVADWERNGSTLPLQDSTEQDTTEQDRTEACGTPAKPSKPPAPHVTVSDPSAVAFPEFPCIPGKRNGGNVWLLTEAYVAELASTFPALDVAAECRKAHGWIKANLERRKTTGGMQDFLFRWLVREQNSGNGNVRHVRKSAWQPPKIGTP